MFNAIGSVFSNWWGSTPTQQNETHSKDNSKDDLTVSTFAHVSDDNLSTDRQLIEQQVKKFDGDIAALTSPTIAASKATQVVARRLIEMGANTSYIEYDSGNRLRLYTVIEANFPYTNLSNAEKERFNAFLAQENNQAFNTLTINIEYKATAAKVNTAAITCMMYNYDKTPDALKKNIENWTQFITKLKGDVQSYHSNSNAVIESPKRKTAKEKIQKREEESLDKFFEIDQLCLNTFALMPDLKTYPAEIELRRFFKSKSQAYPIQVSQQAQTGNIAFTKFLRTTDDFSSSFSNVLAQNQAIKQMQDNVLKVRPEQETNSVENSPQVFNLPEYTMFISVNTGFSEANRNELKSRFETFVASTDSLNQTFMQKNK